MLLTISVILTVLKLAGIIAWSWLIVLLPAAVAFLIFIFVVAMAVIAAILKELNS